MSPVFELTRLLERILLCVHMGNSSPVDRDEIQNQTKMVEHKRVSYATIAALFLYLLS